MVQWCSGARDSEIRGSARGEAEVNECVHE